MKMSTRGRYGMRLMLDITLHGTGQPVALKEIAARQEISEKYLEQIISLLSKAGLVHGTRGVGGGYLLARPPQEITAGDVLRAVEGDLNFVECLRGDGCHRSAACISVELWREMSQSIETVANRHTLQSMVEQYRHENANHTNDSHLKPD